MTNREEIKCPNCGEETISIIKKNHHSSRSSFSGGTTIKVLSSKCERCGEEKLSKKLKKKGWNISK